MTEFLLEPTAIVNEQGRLVIHPEVAADLAEANQEDCLANQFPTCGGCL